MGSHKSESEEHGCVKIKNQNRITHFILE